MGRQNQPPVQPRRRVVSRGRRDPVTRHAAPLSNSRRRGTLISGALSLGLTIVATACSSAPVKSGAETTGPAPIQIAPLPAPGTFYTPGLAQFGAALALPANDGERRLRQSLRRTLAPPPALDCYAREYAGRFAAEGRDPDPQTAQHLATHCGLWDRPARPISVTAASLDSIEAHLGKLPSGRLQGAVAMGVAPHPDGRFTVTLIPVSPAVLIEPIPRAGPLKIVGRAIRGDGRLELWADGPDHPSQKLPIEVDSTGRFQADLGAAEGFDRFEIARKRGRFRQTVALIRRGPLASSYPVYRAPPGDAPDIGLLPAIVNAQRKAAGVSPLRTVPRLTGPLDDWLERLARRTAPQTPPGVLDDRGWPYSIMRFGLTEGADVSQAVSLLVNTPTGARLLLAPEVDEVAFGARPFAQGRGLDLIILTLRAFEASDPDTARAALLEKLNAERARAGFAPLVAAPSLAGVAQEVAARALSGALPWDQAVPQLMETVRRQKLARGAFGAGAFPAVRLEEAPISDEASAMARDVRHIGLGVVGGPLPNGGAPRYLVVYIVAEKLPGKG